MQNLIKVRSLINDILPGGAQVIAIDIMRSLPKENFDAGLWYLYRQSASRTTLHDRAGINGPELVDLNISGIIQGIWSVSRKLRKEEIDILHCHLPVSIIIGSFAARLAGKTKVIAHHHNTHAFNSWKINLLLRIASLCIDLHICFAESVEQELFRTSHLITAPITQLPATSCTVLNFVDTVALDVVVKKTDRNVVRAALNLNAQDIVIFMSGRMIPWKGHETLIRSMTLVLAKQPKAILVLAGDGYLRAHLEDLARNLGVSSRVLFLGERTDIFSLLAISDIFASPYQYDFGTKIRETVGVAVLEAMAAGLPVVISDYPSARIFAQDGRNASIVTPGDAESLSLTLLRLCNDPALRESLGSSASQFVHKNLSLIHAVIIYTSIYHTLIEL
jgi:glycosyltransferase involved in cell wall biosynthesis